MKHYEAPEQALEYLEDNMPSQSVYSWFVSEMVNIYNDSIHYEFQKHTTGHNEALSESILRTKELLKGFILSLVSGGFNTPENNLGDLSRAFDKVWDFHVLEGNMRGYIKYEGYRKRKEQESKEDLTA